MTARGRGSGALLSPRTLCLAAALLLVGAADASAQESAGKPPLERSTQVSVFVGQHVDNSWQDVFDTTAKLEYADAGLIGIAWGRDWRRPGRSFSFGFELQVDWQFGEQQHLEFNLPAVVRYNLPQGVPVLHSLAFLLGPSYTTKVPEYEVESRGDSEQFLMYWAMEAEFGPRDGASSGFVRLHHRSGMFGTLSDDGSSNALVLGVRRRW